MFTCLSRERIGNECKAWGHIFICYLESVSTFHHQQPVSLAFQALPNIVQIPRRIITFGYACQMYDTESGPSNDKNSCYYELIQVQISCQQIHPPTRQFYQRFV